MGKYKPVWDARRKGWSFELEGRNGTQGQSAMYFGHSKSEAGFVFTKYNVRNRKSLRVNDVTSADLTQIREFNGTVRFRGQSFMARGDFEAVRETIEVDGKTYSRTCWRIKSGWNPTRRKLNKLREKYKPAQDAHQTAN